MTPDYEDAHMRGYTEVYLKQVWGEEKYLAFNKWIANQTVGITGDGRLIFWPFDVHRFNTYGEKAKVWD